MSPVLEAMGVPKETGLGAIRFSLGRMTARADLEETVAMLVKACKS
jgi:cysteine desulfurase